MKVQVNTIAKTPLERVGASDTNEPIYLNFDSEKMK